MQAYYVTDLARFYSTAVKLWKVTVKKIFQDTHQGITFFFSTVPCS